jgi:hypothetical protein
MLRYTAISAAFWSSLRRASARIAFSVRAFRLTSPWPFPSYLCRLSRRLNKAGVVTSFRGCLLLGRPVARARHQRGCRP